ncbi:MAG: hypothetical protein M3N15_02985 [Actinomycetota bacterium]|nr:hypothetical protein [Actinomycetota bacterium]
MPGRWAYLTQQARSKWQSTRAFVATTEDSDPPGGWQPRTVVARAGVVALHVAPGLLAYALLRIAREPLQAALGITSAEVQIGVIMTGVMVGMAAATFASSRLLDGLGPRQALRLVAADRLDAVGLLLAVVIWVGVLAVSSILDFEEDLRVLVEHVDWLALPEWHFQRIDGFLQLPPVLGGFALMANVVGEELWFRGYLQDKLRFSGGSAGWARACCSPSITCSRLPSPIPASSVASALPGCGPSGVTSGPACCCTRSSTLPSDRSRLGPDGDGSWPTSLGAVGPSSPPREQSPQLPASVIVAVAASAGRVAVHRA